MPVFEQICIGKGFDALLCYVNKATCCGKACTNNFSDLHLCLQAAPVQAVKQVKVENGDDDDDLDLFGSDEEDEEAARIKQERVEAYTAKKAKKPTLIAKSSILLDVKPVCNP